MRQSRVLRSACLLVIGCIAVPTGASRAAAEAPRFQGLGDLPGGAFESFSYDISGDGRVAVGAGTTIDGGEVSRWFEGTGMRGTGATNATAFATSYDASVLVGVGYLDRVSRPFRWDASTGIEYLGNTSPNAPSGGAAGVSPDGSVVVGSFTTGLIIEAFRWTRAEGVVMMGDLPGTHPGYVYGSIATAAAVTPQGLVVVGGGASDRGNEAFRWTAATGMVPLGDLPGGNFDSVANDVTPDGRVIVGFANANQAEGGEAFRWTQEGGMVGLGQLAGSFESYAESVSADGSVVSGRSRTSAGYVAFVWDEAHGIRSLKQALADAGISTTGWRLNDAWVSDDGTRFSGIGINPRGQAEAFFAVLPEPGGAGLLVALAGPLLARRRRRRRVDRNGGGLRDALDQ
jgi:probable HAF family extracellular repeat protein